VLLKNQQDVRAHLFERCGEILATYRKECSNPSSPGQLILPEGMKLLPLYINCLIKSDAISGGQEVNTDDRSWLMQSIPPMRVQDSVAFLYPRFIPLVANSEDRDEYPLPVALRCSTDNLSDTNAYLLENGVVMFLWLGAGLSGQWVHDVFGVQSVAQVNTENGVLPTLQSEASKRLHRIIGRMQAERPRCMKLYIIRQNDKMEPWLKHFLVEDAGGASSHGAPHDSYVDFLCRIHKKIRELVGG